MLQLRWRLLRAVILLTFISLAIGQALAGVGFQPVNQDELKMTSEPKAPGAAAIILFRQVDRDDTGSNPHEDSYYRIKVLTEEGRKYANVEIPYAKSDGWNVNNIKARTIRPDGTVANFEGKPFQTTIVKARGLKYLAKTMTLPDVQVGGIIEYCYTTSYPNDRIFDAHWIVSADLYTKHAHFSFRRAETAYGTNRGIRYTWHGINSSPKDQGGLVVLDVTDIPAFEIEDHMPPENEYKARVDFIYTEDTEQDQTKFWRNKSKRLYAQLEYFIDHKRALQEAVAGIVSASDSPDEKARKIYAAVQRLRNTSYERERTQAEHQRDKEKEINSVEDVWKIGRGNRFEITWLYLAMVRAAGIDAAPVLIADRLNYFFDPATLNSKQLNESAVMLRMGEKKVFCDPGTVYLPYGELPWPQTGVRALVVDQNGGEWVDIPLPGSDATQRRLTARLKLNEEASGLEGKVTIRYTGFLSSQMRRMENLEDETARKQYLEGGLKQMVPLASEVELKNKVDWTSSSPILEAEFDVKIPDWAQTAGRRVLLAQGIFSNEQKHVFEHATRTYPIYYEYPLAKVDDITIDLPEGWTVASMPRPVEVQQKVIGFLSKAEGKGNSLHITRKVSIDIQMVVAKGYLQLQNFYRMVRTADEGQIVLLPIVN